eukprot:scaffold3146_cov69-Phaeocystis_antarctica.AAC.1
MHWSAVACGLWSREKSVRALCGVRSVLPGAYSSRESSRYCSRSRHSASQHMRMHVPKPVPPPATAAAGGAQHNAAAARRCESRCAREAPLGVKPLRCAKPAVAAAAGAQRGAGAVAGRAGPRWLPRRCGGRYDIGLRPSGGAAAAASQGCQERRNV